MDTTHFHNVRPETLKTLVLQVFDRLGVKEKEAQIIADVLLAADLRGVDSHGVGRLGFYVDQIKNGSILPLAVPQVIHETPVSALIDAQNGLGHPVSHQAMSMAIQKAEQVGVGIVTVKNSSHYGIAGYYAMMALEKQMVGMSMTNTRVFVSPTFARSAMMGTNPIAVAFPAGKERPWVLDMATSIVPYGKLETYNRLGKNIPLGWATDETGKPSEDPQRVMQSMSQNPIQGGLLPLGGFGELMGGHKGYGLVALVDILCGVLPGALYADLAYPKSKEGKPMPPGLGHIFAAMRIDLFRPVEDFKASLDDFEQRLRNAPKAEGYDRIYIHGEKEYEIADKRSREGIPVSPKLYQELQTIANDFGLSFDH